MQAEGEVVRLPTRQVEHGARFDTFVEEEHVRLFKALYFVTGSLEEAEDLAQEAFLKLWELWDRIETIRDPTAYLFRVALNGFRMRRRRAAMAIRKLPAPPEQRDGYVDAEMREDVRRLLLEVSHGNGPPFCLLTSSAIRPSRPRASSGSDRRRYGTW
jgi:DNA-directed RNA polymerase specialized sigma24 family protein